MELHLNGSTPIKAPKRSVFDLLTDPNFLAKTLPDSEDVRIVDASTLEARLRVKVAVVSSTLMVRMTVSAKEPPESATLYVEGSGSGSSLRISSRFTLSGDSPTLMEWTANAEVGGIMAGLGSTLLRSLATKKVDEIFSGIAKAVEQAPT